MWKVCPESGGPTQFPGFNGNYAVLSTDCLCYKIYFFTTFSLNKLWCLSVGELMCPAYYELCGTGPPLGSGHCPNSCNFNGDCVDGSCHCFLGFHGHDCSKRELCSPLFLLCSQCTEYKFASEISHFWSIFDLASVLNWYFLQAPAPPIVMDMGNASLTAFVNVKMGSLVLTAPLVKEYPLFTFIFLFALCFCWLIICLMVKLHTAYFLVAFMFVMFKLPFLKQLFCVNGGKEIQRAMLYILKTCLEKYLYP